VAKIISANNYFVGKGVRWLLMMYRGLDRLPMTIYKGVSGQDAPMILQSTSQISIAMSVLYMYAVFKKDGPVCNGWIQKGVRPIKREGKNG
jgi:hypothetical protein